MIQSSSAGPQPGDQSERMEDRAEALLQLAEDRLRRGLAPPPEVYRIKNRSRIDWSNFPAWARPTDPDIFEGCCHEG